MKSLCAMFKTDQKKRENVRKRDLNQHLIFKANANNCEFTASLQRLQSKNPPAAGRTEGRNIAYKVEILAGK